MRTHSLAFQYLTLRGSGIPLFQWISIYPVISMTLGSPVWPLYLQSHMLSSPTFLHHKVPLWLLGLWKRNSPMAALGQTGLTSGVWFSSKSQLLETVWPLSFCPCTSESLLQCWVQTWKTRGGEAWNPQAFPDYLNRQMDLDRNPKELYLLKKKRLISYILNHSKSYQGKTNSILNPVFSSSERRQMAQKGRKDHWP